MGKLLFIFFMGLNLSIFSKSDSLPSTENHEKQITITKKISKVDSLYENMNLSNVVNYKAFKEAMEGYRLLPAKNKDIITIIDFTLASTEKRLVVLDLKNEKVLFHSLVSHGKNSGDNYATSFSNRPESFQSSLGFYVTENTYQGENGYSLVLNGLEKGFNDQAKARAVVIHGADYCSLNVVDILGRLGRSYGCPALPRELSRPIINTIKDGSLLFIYADNKEYLAKSTVLNHHNELMAHYQDDMGADRLGTIN
ncbi:murein L,D-transpeptidase catalytic domain family protein [Sphingobacterium sp. SRCM116780]|uniref:murein L,D-transpeptidase catalytic domain family protein n=1 Tax=Sphingobacterium sp. SRCM116780 TaxID=2907623 RepID=UPI001F3DAFA0|nr:murein L,D-transpeptidase catalytic domain family protein [Sphingobacterium sp. SRCM116780]UIR57783.1 murein L,D-transpeptidase catalytic domain family protein [Sphingobacterium sp. SRCM116780]